MYCLVYTSKVMCTVPPRKVQRFLNPAGGSGCLGYHCSGTGNPLLHNRRGGSCMVQGDATAKPGVSLVRVPRVSSGSVVQSSSISALSHIPTPRPCDLL